jgi:protein ImuB
MPRVMCVWFPRWPIQRLRAERRELRRSDLVLFAGRAQRPIVTDCTEKAERHGVRIGQPLTEARALLPRAIFLPAEDEADTDALRRLALECQKFSPLVGLEDDPRPSSLLGHVDGCTHLWKDEYRFLQQVDGYWRDRSYRTQIALACSVGAAWALSHTLNFSVVPAGEEESAVWGLPVAALRLPSAVLEQLHALGLWTIGDVLKLPREGLVSRFGAVLPRRLDQLFGLRPESFVCERLQEPLSTFREWEAPIDDRLALVQLCRQMLRELLSMADRHGLGIQELEGEIRTEAGPIAIAMRLVEPTRDEGHLGQLLELQLERQSWSGGVLAVRWTAHRLGRPEEVQGSWFGDDPEPERSRTFNALVDRLSSRLAAEAVLRVELLPDAQPEYTDRPVPCTNLGPTKAEAFAIPPEQSRGRPLRLLGLPQPIDVIPMGGGGPPIHMVWLGQNYPVARSWGPERIATGWWRAQDVQRDYYRAEWSQGTHVWVYRELRTGRWYLHGFFD